MNEYNLSDAVTGTVAGALYYVLIKPIKCVLLTTTSVVAFYRGPASMATVTILCCRRNNVYGEVEYRQHVGDRSDRGRPTVEGS